MPRRAFVFELDGTVREVARPPRGFTLEQLYALVGCQVVERVQLLGHDVLWVDEEGKVREPVKPINNLASVLHWAAGAPSWDYIAGTALLESSTFSITRHARTEGDS